KEQAATRSARTGKRQNERRESGVGIGLVLTFPTPVDLTLRSDWLPLLTVSLPSNSCLCPRLRPKAHPPRIRTPFRSERFLRSAPPPAPELRATTRRALEGSCGRPGSPDAAACTRGPSPF